MVRVACVALCAPGAWDPERDPDWPAGSNAITGDHLPVTKIRTHRPEISRGCNVQLIARESSAATVGLCDQSAPCRPPTSSAEGSPNKRERGPLQMCKRGPLRNQHEITCSCCGLSSRHQRRS
uniref:Uncharacterized protein n=1 Tax=Zea mays TaxID=4577 RepID=A0A804LUI2_MAIZE